MRKALWIVIIGLILYPLVSSIGFVVDQRQYAILSSGEVKQLITEPGWYFKQPKPLQNLVILDRRIQTTESTDQGDVITADKNYLQIDSYVKWRITDPMQHYLSFSGDKQRVQNRVAEMSKLALNAEVAKRPFAEVLSGDRDKLMADVQKRMADDAKAIGIDIVDVRIKRIGFNEKSTAAIYENMNAERGKQATQTRVTGTADAEKMRADADKQRAAIIAEGYRDAQKIRGEGDAEATRIYAQSFGQNPEFAKFWRSLEAYRESFKNRTDVIVLDPSSEFFRYMKNPKPSSAK